MFQFPSFASCTYVFSAGYPAYTGWVSPFGNVRIKACLPAPRTLSQAPTSFIASNCLGIHRVRLVAWPYNSSNWYYLRLTIGCVSKLKLLKKKIKSKNGSQCKNDNFTPDRYVSNKEYTLELIQQINKKSSQRFVNPILYLNNFTFHLVKEQLIVKNQSFIVGKTWQ